MNYLSFKTKTCFRSLIMLLKTQQRTKKNNKSLTQSLILKFVDCWFGSRQEIYKNSNRIMKCIFLFHWNLCCGNFNIYQQINYCHLWSKIKCILFFTHFHSTSYRAGSGVIDMFEHWSNWNAIHKWHNILHSINSWCFQVFKFNSNSSDDNLTINFTLNAECNWIIIKML